MFNATEHIIESYLESEEYGEFAEKNKTEEAVEEMGKHLIKKFGEENKDIIDTALMATFSTGEHYGMVQGIGIGINLMNEHK